LLGTGGLIALVRVWREPSPKPGTPDAMAVALAQNTRSQEVVAGQFGENLKQFAAVNRTADEMLEEMRTARRAMQQAVDHLSAIREQSNRRAP
jgi:hypothetical protein